MFKQDNAGKAGKQQRGPVYDGGPPAAQVVSNIGLLSQTIDLTFNSHDKSKGLGDGGIGLIRWFRSIHECNSICVAGQWSE